MPRCDCALNLCSKHVQARQLAYHWCTSYEVPDDENRKRSPEDGVKQVRNEPREDGVLAQLLERGRVSDG